LSGSEIAKIFARYGYNLLLVGRNEQKLMSVASMCTSINNNIKAEVILLDLALDGAPQVLFEHCQKNKIKVDYLVNSGIEFFVCFNNSLHPSCETRKHSKN
jgi:short-subunit dehydrogenase